FISGPVTVGDDQGTDKICTLYERGKSAKGANVLIARSSVAVQVKSGNAKPINVKKNLPYLAHLEIPFYLGFVNQAKSSLEIYSARFLPAMFSMLGSGLKRLRLIPVRKFERIYRSQGGNYSNPWLKCHKVATLRVGDSSKKVAKAAKTIRD